MVMEISYTQGNATTEAQRAQTAVMNTIAEVNNFDKIKVAKYMYKDTAKRTTQTRTPTKQMCRYCGSNHPQGNAWHMGRCVQLAANLATSEQYVGAKGPEL